MGLGPSTKMTTLHHFNCPVTQVLMKDNQVDFLGVLVDGVSENYNDKVFTATRTAELVCALGADGAIVAIDGWGNHHLDFITVINNLGDSGIPCVGLSYIGTQGKLVATGPHIRKIVDFNKSASGFESCVVGENNLDKKDATIACAILKNILRKKDFLCTNDEKHALGSLEFEHLYLQTAELSDKTSFNNGHLTINSALTEKYVPLYKRISSAKLSILPSSEKNKFINCNLDFMPIATKKYGTLGNGKTLLLNGMQVMLTAVDENGVQPANIGSSEGILNQQVVFDRAGTPKSSDYILHIDVILKENEARSPEGICEAHFLADDIVQDIRQAMLKINADKKEVITHFKKTGGYKIILVKVVSGLGNMYDTVIFPKEPAGIKQGRLMRNLGNMPVFLTPMQVLDGALHSLL